MNLESDKSLRSCISKAICRQQLIIQNIIDVLDGGDSYITVLINLDTLKLDEFYVGG